MFPMMGSVAGPGGSRPRRAGCRWDNTTLLLFLRKYTSKVATISSVPRLILHELIRMLYGLLPLYRNTCRWAKPVQVSPATSIVV